jgi:peptide/nickel transport system substrate-binding protein
MDPLPRIAPRCRRGQGTLSRSRVPGRIQRHLGCPNHRYINDEAICRAVAFDLGEIGIQVTVAAAPKAEHFPKIALPPGLGRIYLRLAEPFLTFFHSRGSHWSAPGYANPRVDERIDTIGHTLVTYARDAVIEEVWKIVLDDVVYLTIHHQVILWAMRQNLDVPVDRFYRPILREARFSR